MVLMTVDHASLFFNAGRISADSAGAYVPSTPLPLDQFLLRWVTHLCAPTFLFLAGVSLALSSARRAERGMTRQAIDRDLLLRGGLIVALDLSYMSVLAQHLICQVLYAIGLSMIFMVWLRRIADRWLLCLALAWFVGGEGVTGLVWTPPENAHPLAALLVARYTGPSVLIMYPVVPWCAIMACGWVCGNLLRTRGAAALQRALLAAGAAGLAVFGVVRGLSGYGNMWLQREDDSIQHWLHTSKYPPSLSYLACELGLMAICLATLLWLAERVRVQPRGPLLVLGQTALFYYLAHFALLGIGRALGVPQGGIPAALSLAALTLLILYPACRAFRAAKQTRPGTWLRFI